LIEDFAAHRAEFDVLANLATQDRHLWRVSRDWYRLAGGENRQKPSLELSEERWKAYRRAFAVLDLRTGVTVVDDGLLLHRHSEGFLDTGSSKGFAFMMRIPDPVLVLPSLDIDPYKTEPSDYYAIRYRHLEGPWYLYVDRYR
jgi:hypothetical protein